MVQELFPAAAASKFSYCAFFRNGEAVGKMVVRRTRQHPFSIWKSQHVCRDGRRATSGDIVRAIPARDRFTTV